jgi:hypothetical protein
MNAKLAVLSLIALTGVAVPAVVAAPKPDQKLSIAADPDTVTFGRDLKVTGQLTGGTQRDVSGQRVTLERDPYPYEGQFERVDTVETNGTGNYGFTLKPGLSSKYRTSAKGGVESPEVTVPVRVAVTLAVSDTTPNRGARVRFSGTVTPAHDGKVARVQRRTSSGWKTIAEAPLTDAGDTVSNYSKRVRIRRSGRYRVRVRPRDGDHVAGNSRRVRLTVG